MIGDTRIYSFIGTHYSTLPKSYTAGVFTKKISYLEQFDKAIATALNSLLASGASRITPLALCGAITCLWTHIQSENSNEPCAIRKEK